MLSAKLSGRLFALFGEKAYFCTMKVQADNNEGGGAWAAIRSVFSIFKVKPGERGLALCVLAYAVVLNVLVVAAHWQWFSRVTDDYRKLVLRHFHVSGFDPITYLVLNDWSAAYNIYRHPLLVFFMWPFSCLNRALMAVAGVNMAQVLTALILVFCAFYAALFLYRILREVVGVRDADARLLTAFYLGCGYVMVSSSVPDHFCLSAAALLLTLYVAGRKLQRRKPFTKWQTVLFFLLTAGISLNNGIKVFLANWLVNGKRFWRPANLLLAVVIPSGLIWAFAQWEWRTFERPKYVERQQMKARKAQKERVAVWQKVASGMPQADTAAIGRATDSVLAVRAAERKQRNARKAMYAHQGKPIAKGGFASWTDVSTPRWESMVENFFGEPVQLHPDYVLGDVLVNRPVIVPYRYVWSYAVEAIVVLFFLAGVWAGRRSRFLWLALSWMGFDMLIHVVLGFGLNEVYIMSPHWLFVLPIAMACLQRSLSARCLLASRVLLVALSCYLLVTNGALYVQHLLF